MYKTQYINLLKKLKQIDNDLIRVDYLEEIIDLKNTLKSLNFIKIKIKKGKNIMINKNFIFYSDSGHGWLRVKRNELKDLNIENNITPCSYQNNDYVYLEEDLDATTFINAYKNKYNCEPILKTSYSHQSHIRQYENYRI